MSARILAAIEKAHDDAPRTRVEVPEWDGAVLYFPSVLTVRMQENIRAGVAPGNEGGLMVNFLLHLAQNEDGSNVFKVDAATRAALEKVDLRVLTRIVEACGAPPSLDDQKNG